MPKRKKTRKQKMLADTRRQTIQSAFSPSFSLEKDVKDVINEEKKEQPAPSVIAVAPSRHIATLDYQYLSKDLLKTMIFTGSVVIVELVLRFFSTRF